MGSSVGEVLDAIGVDYTEISGEYMVMCPWHNNYRTAAGEIADDTGLFYCFACHHASTLQEFVMKVTGKSWFEAARIVRVPINLEKVKSKIDEPIVAYDESKIIRHHEELMIHERAQDYFIGRGINRDSMQRFQLGYSFAADMVLVPIHDPEGTPIGMVGRSILGKDFRNTPGMKRSSTLFNLHRVKRSKSVFVVESTFDAIRIDQLGFHAVATLGSSISNKQIELIKKYFLDYYVVPDRDEAGKTMAVKLMNAGATLVKIPPQYKDIGEMPDSEIAKTLSATTEFKLDGV